MYIKQIWYQDCLKVAYGHQLNDVKAVLVSIYDINLPREDKF